jgi:hypothetical protein
MARVEKWKPTCARTEPAEVVSQVPQVGIGPRDGMLSHPSPPDIQRIAPIILVLERNSVIFDQTALSPRLCPQIVYPEFDQVFGLDEGEDVYSLQACD